MQPLLILSSIGAMTAAGVFLAAGAQFRQRSVSDESRAAAELFMVWWTGLAVVAAAHGLSDLLLATGAGWFPLLVGLHYLQVCALAIGIWGLVYYLSHILLGAHRGLAPLAAFYACYYGLVLFVLTLGQPVAVAPDPLPRLVLAAPVMPLGSLVLLLLIPPAVASVTYVAWFGRAGGRLQRWRVALVSLGTLAWCAASFARGVGGPAGAAISLGLLSAWMVLWAYAPPEWLARRVAAPGFDAR